MEVLVLIIELPNSCKNHIVKFEVDSTLCILADTPLEASSGTFSACLFVQVSTIPTNVAFKSLKYFFKNSIFMISHGRMVVTSPKVVINLPGTYEKVPC